MLLPYLSEVQNPSKKYSIAFRGINYGENTQDGEFAETQNLSTDKYPCLSPRATRVLRSLGVYPTTLFAKGDKLLIVDKYTQDDYAVYFGLGGRGEMVGKLPQDGKKQIASVGNYILIFPDKKYYNVETGVFGDMEETYGATGLVFTDSTITTKGDDFPFREGDGVTISGCSTNANNVTLIVRGVAGNVLTFYENSFTAGEESGTVTIKREIPDLDFVCESNNRLWGTHGNTIYASKFSDPLNFQVFDGLSSDSYYIDVGTDGEFTGCTPYSSHICFFKENTLHKLYGTKPSNFQVTDVKVSGVQKGSERSIQLVNEMLLYKGVNGVYAYTGGVPELISENFGNRRFSDAVACSDGEKYYISMKSGDTFSFYVYDIMRNIWLKEDDLEVVDMVFYRNKIYYLDAEPDKTSVASFGDLYYIDKEAERSDIEWSATFCTFHETINERKVYSKFHLRLDLAEGSWLAVDMKTDNGLKWKQIYATHDSKARTISVPIMPTRCDSIDIRLRGKGDCTIKSFVREFTTGSDV